jgi:hypothetical protein
MSMTSVQTSTRDMANYGGVVDAIGGAATVVLAIIGLSGTNADLLLAIATIVFGTALLIQSGAILSELTHIIFPARAGEPIEEFRGGGLSIVFLVGSAGIVLGVLALLGIYRIELISIAIIAFGSALVFGSNAVWSVHRMKQAAYRAAGQRAVAGSEILATILMTGSTLSGAVQGFMRPVGSARSWSESPAE